jgi:hypothetical protein
VAEDLQPVNNDGALNQRPARQQDEGPPDVLLNVGNLDLESTFSEVGLLSGLIHRGFMANW